jgi:flavin-binding protein dodecin
MSKGKHPPERKGGSMSVARVTEISATNPDSFEAAINEAISRATSTLRNVEGAWVKDMNVLISNNNVVGYKVNLAVTFVLEDAGDIG